MNQPRRAEGDSGSSPWIRHGVAKREAGLTMLDRVSRGALPDRVLRGAPLNLIL